MLLELLPKLMGDSPWQNEVEKACHELGLLGVYRRSGNGRSTLLDLSQQEQKVNTLPLVRPIASADGDGVWFVEFASPDCVKGYAWLKTPPRQLGDPTTSLTYELLDGSWFLFREDR